VLTTRPFSIVSIVELSPSRQNMTSASRRASLPACPRTSSCYCGSSWKRSRGG